MSNSELELAARLQSQGIHYENGGFYRVDPQDPVTVKRLKTPQELQAYLERKGLISLEQKLRNIATHRSTQASDIHQWEALIIQHCRSHGRLVYEKPLDTLGRGGGC
jgi:hypothetical protein